MERLLRRKKKAENSAVESVSHDIKTDTSVLTSAQKVGGAARGGEIQNWR